jgi:hypothetical protein
MCDAINRADGLLLQAHAVANMLTSALFDAAAAGERGLDIGVEQTGAVAMSILTMVDDARKALSYGPPVTA